MDDCVSQKITAKAPAFLLGTHIHSEYLHKEESVSSLALLPEENSTD